MIPIRICSPGKDLGITAGYLRELYTDPMLQAFFRACKGRPYAILSRKYGLCWSDRVYPQYTDGEMKDDDLLLLLQYQRRIYDDIGFLYWNHRPLTHNKWVKMLRAAGFPVKEVRTLAELR